MNWRSEERNSSNSEGMLKTGMAVNLLEDETARA